jgi:acyl carrier protein
MLLIKISKIIIMNEEMKRVGLFLIISIVMMSYEKKNRLQSTFSLGEDEVSDEIKTLVKEKIAQIKKIAPESIAFTTNLVLDLHCDSLDMAEIKASLQSAYPQSSNPPIGILKTVADLCAMVSGALQ